ncbi:MAG: DUF3556 domain-containing protein [Deltaproteobacteria bacterium]|nr:DUF3556 domain-containing protein [Deltaproteobacteria bacterium]
MGLLHPVPPPYKALDWVTHPLHERGRMVCEAWALQGYGTPPFVYVLYALKIGLYVGVWLACCAMTPGLGGPTTIAAWWLEPLAFQKAIAWSMLFEGLGLGCGSGPLTGRYVPPIGGVLYFMRPGTTKLPWIRGLGTRRTWLDVVLYASIIGLLGYVLVAATPPRAAIIAIVIAVPLLALRDRTMFLAFRGEHYWTTMLCFAITADWIAGAMAVQLALWFWAGVSKLNHHFPAVVCVMASNSPFTVGWIRKRMYRHYPDDLRPSRFAIVMAHLGTSLELGVPIVLVVGASLGLGEPALMLALGMMIVLHTFITTSVPMGVPLEWNVMVVYGGFALFWAHPSIGLGDVGLTLAPVLVGMLVIVPLLGNVFPHRLSFLLAMRYYAGNWAWSVWLFRGDSAKKLAALVTSAPWIYDQLARFYDRETAVGLVGKVMGFRMMHLHGRALPLLLPRALEADLAAYEYLDGELVAGLTLGWNFGDGHLHHEPLLAAVQAQCAFEPGELRCIFVEPQPLGQRTIAYRIVDASSGQLEAGALEVAELRTRQPWAAS